MKPISVIIPIFGQHQLMVRLLSDIEKESHLTRVLVVDNGMNWFSPFPWTEVVTPNDNLGWLRGTNYGLQTAMRRECSLFVCLNNDTRLSPGFFSALLKASEEPGCDLFSPAYDGDHGHQTPSNGYHGPAALYTPTPLLRRVHFVDGTCLCIPRRTLETIGLLDESFGQWGWGADQDYAIRVKARKGRVYVTEEAFLNHLGRATAERLETNYRGLAWSEQHRSMTLKWGPEWGRLTNAL